MPTAQRAQRRAALAAAAALAIVVSLLSTPTTASAGNPRTSAMSVPPSEARTAAVLASTQPADAAPKPSGPPAAPAAPTVSRRGGTATVTWKAPADHGAALTGYVVTPHLNGKKAKPVTFDSPETSQKISGLAGKGTYTFTVAAKNAVGTGPASPRSKGAKIMALPAAPTIVAVTADTVTAVLSWAPGADGGSPILGYEVTPYVGGVRQASQTFGRASTQTVTGLISTVTYRFSVAARTAEGTGPESALSQEVTANVSPTLLWNAPTSATVGISYSATLNITHGAPPFVWSLASGTLPPGLALNPQTNGISGVPTTAGVYPVVIRVADSEGQSGTRLIILTVNLAPVLNFRRRRWVRSTAPTPNSSVSSAVQHRSPGPSPLGHCPRALRSPRPAV
ncbi:hypothetical protein GCM10027614_71270 [Micromonospora vulcania]